MSEPVSASEKPWPSPLRAWWVAIVLMLANTLAFVDRQALALLVQPIKKDLAISDTAISLLYGLSFTLFYVAVGLPIARIADRSNRRNIVAGAILSGAWRPACAASRAASPACLPRASAWARARAV
jgi:predicted MFS family arabinose efflux permease